MVSAGAHGRERQSACDGGRHAAVRHRTVTELARVVRAPTVRRAAGGDAAGVGYACAQRREPEAARHQDWPAPRQRSVAELTVAIVAPAVAATCGGEAARVSEAGGFGGGTAGPPPPPQGGRRG